jgi:hypothetical protein
MLLKSLEVVKFFRGFLTNKLNSFFMKWRWKITRDLRNDYITRQLWVQILFANFPGFKNNVLFIMTDFRHENNFRTNLSFLTDSKSFGWQRELKVKAWKSLFLSLLQRVSMSEVHFLCLHGMDTWNLKGTTKVQKCICDEIRLNNIDIDILLLVFVAIVTFRVCEWKREKRKKVEKVFADILLPRDLAGGRFATIVI